MLRHDREVNSHVKISSVLSAHCHLSWSCYHFDGQEFNRWWSGTVQVKAAFIFNVFFTKVYYPKHLPKRGRGCPNRGWRPKYTSLQAQQSLNRQQWILSDLCCGHCLFFNRHSPLHNNKVNYANSLSNSMGSGHQFGRAPVTWMDFTEQKTYQP